MRAALKFGRLPWLLAIPLLAVAARAQPADAPVDAPAISVYHETAVVSSYLWRGMVLNDSVSLQPGLVIGWRGLSISSWQSFSRRVPHGQMWTSSDMNLEYARSVRKFTASVGYWRYHYPDMPRDEGETSHEFYAGVAHKSWLNPSLKFSTDVSLGGGHYWFGSVAHGFELSSRLTLNTSLGVGLNQHYYQTQTTISDVDGVASLDIRLTRHLVISPGFVQMVGHRSLFGRHHAFSLKVSLAN
ncbi:MAG TPA: TorF family putative porin [Bryobacteraceae bacterium]|nr:TorF family putative porin [Bryobacteraceae bacterium]